MKKLFVYVLLLSAGIACKEKYELPSGPPSKGYLVVDGIINSGQGPTTIRLSRTLALVDSVASRPEVRATVRIQGEDNSSITLTEISPGTYYINQLSLNPNVKYRLRINTTGGQEILSDYVAVKKTPPVDSITWERPEDGVQLYVNTHDPQNNTLYYRWEFEETWEFNSSEASNITYLLRNGKPYDVGPRDPAERARMYTCWQSSKSTSLLIGSSVKLSRDTIHLPIHFVPQGSWKISVMYSILVRQFAVSRENYEFLQRMKKNTEQVGSLFDAQPSELVGNIHNATKPEEVVIGFIDIADAREKRIFIRRSEVSPWSYSMSCDRWVVANNPDSMEAFSFFVPIDVAATSQFTGDTIAIFVGEPDCLDCRRRGTDVKPSFWP